MGSFHKFSTYRNLPRAEHTWVVKDLLPSGGKAVFFAPPKTGKSWAALQIAVGIGRGDDEALGFVIEQGGPVFYLQLDTPRGLWVDTYLLPLQKEIGDLGEVWFADREEVPSYPFDIRYQGHREWLRGEVERVKPVVVVVDTWREAFRGRENDSDTAQDVLSSFVGATDPSALVIISHVAKESQDPEAKERSLVDKVRGSTYLMGAVDGGLLVGKKQLTFISRTQPDAKVKLERGIGGMWITPEVDWRKAIEDVLSDRSLLSLPQRIMKLAEKTSRSPALAEKALLSHLGRG